MADSYLKCDKHDGVLVIYLDRFTECPICETIDELRREEYKTREKNKMLIAWKEKVSAEIEIWKKELNDVLQAENKTS